MQPQKPTISRALKSFVLAFVSINLLLAALEPLFIHTWHLPSPSELFSLSVSGMSQGFYWQLISYAFAPSSSFGFALFLNVAIIAYLLWVFGNAIILRKGPLQFFLIFASSAILGGLAALAIPEMLSLATAWPATYGIMFAWLVLYSDAPLLLFFVIPLRAKWLIVGLLAFNLLTDLAAGHIHLPVALLASSATGYLYAVLVWKRHSPFISLHRWENLFMQLVGRSPRQGKGKIYDFRTGEVIDSDQKFLDDMLSKIAQGGTKSLSWRERWRLRRIHKSRKK